MILICFFVRSCTGRKMFLPVLWNAVLPYVILRVWILFHWWKGREYILTGTSPMLAEGMSAHCEATCLFRIITWVLTRTSGPIAPKTTLKMMELESIGSILKGSISVSYCVLSVLYSFSVLYKWTLSPPLVEEIWRLRYDHLLWTLMKLSLRFSSVTEWNIPILYKESFALNIYRWLQLTFSEMGK